MKSFFSKSAEEISDRDLLEGIIAVAFSCEDAKAISDSLFAKYNSLSNILKADAPSLLKLDGISEQMAVFISIHHSLRQKMMNERNIDITNLSSFESRKAYGANLLRVQKVEVIAIINLDKNMDIISSSVISHGGANFSQVSPAEMIKAVMYEQPEYVIIMHNHPEGDSAPSLQDFNFTVNAKEIFNSVGFKLIDHIIVGSDSEYSMSESAGKYFTD